MMQKIIKVGNSYAVTIPKAFVKATVWKQGDKVMVNVDVKNRIVTIYKKQSTFSKHGITPEFVRVAEAFIERHKDVLKELAKR